MEKEKKKRRGGCLRSCLICLAVYFGLCFVFGLIFGDMFKSPTVNLTDYTVYELNLEGSLVEQGSKPSPFGDMMSDIPGYNTEKTTGLDQILDNISLAEKDDKIRGIYLRGGEMSMSPASAKAIRDRLTKFKTESGKFVIAYSDNYNVTNYYVASVADKIYLNPTGHIGWNGLAAQKLYLTRLLEKVGVEMQILKVGTYKSAVEPYFRTSMSEADKQQTKLYLDGIWDYYTSAVSASRKINSTDLNRYADEFMEVQPVEKYVNYHFVDELVYREDMDSILRMMTGSEDYKLLKTDKLQQVPRKAEKATNRVAVLYAAGTIVDDGSTSQGEVITPKQIQKQVKKILKDEQVKAVVFRVNSPGGSADASEQIWHSIQLLREKGLPVVVSMGDLAASGGYYISCGADYIFAEPTTLTGSIGIFGTIPNMKGLRQKIGVDVDGIGTNKHSLMQATMLTDGMTAEERALMQAMIERGYDLFTQRCADGRHLTQERIKEIGEGRVWLGVDAQPLRLVDRFGNIQDALDKAAELAQIEGYGINYYPDAADPMEELLKMFYGNNDEEEALLARAGLPQRLIRQLLPLKKVLEEPAVLMMLEPVTIE